MPARAFDGFSLPPPPAPKVTPEKWFVILIAGSPVGSLHDVASRKSTPAGDILVYSSEMRMVLNRLGSKVEMRFLTVSEETPAGVLLRETYDVQASQMVTHTEAVVKDGRLELRSEAGGKAYDRTIPFSGVLLGQEGVRLLSLARLRKPGDAAEFQIFAPETEAVALATRTYLAAETIEIGGATVEAVKVAETIESAGVKSTGWMDASHEIVRQEMPTPFGPGVFILADQAAAERAAGGGALPPEIFERSIVRTNVRIPHARSLAALRVRLAARDADLSWPAFEGPGVAVVSRDGTALTLDLERQPAPDSAPFPAAETDALREFLRPNAYIQSDEAAVGTLAREVAGEERDAFRAVLRLRRWVTENMTFDLGIALAPSSEIFANRRGTCLGYATLLATLARSLGIPSRVVVGCAYVSGMFGGHAWTEVRIGERWVPVDAALPSAGPADAARIPLGASSFADGGALGGGLGLQLLGRIDLRILRFTGGDGRPVDVPEGAAPYGMGADSYVNPWLGIELAKPRGFGFAKADAVWPSAVVVALEGPGGLRAELQELSTLPWRPRADAVADVLRQLRVEGTPRERRVGSLLGHQAESRNRSVIVLIDGGEAWALVVDGPGASALLDKLAAGLKFSRR